MKVIVIASRKGGVGKTTLSGSLGVAAERAGHGPVALIDTDIQGSLAAWWNSREAETPLFASLSVHQLENGIEELRRAGVKLLIIDTPPAITKTISQVVKHADLVLIPTRPSPHDLRAIGATVDLVSEQGKKMIFIVNGAANRARITADAAVALSEHGAVAPTIIYQRTDFATSMIDGRTVQELDQTSKSANEIAKLWKYVYSYLSKKSKRV